MISFFKAVKKTIKGVSLTLVVFLIAYTAWTFAQDKEPQTKFLGSFKPIFMSDASMNPSIEKGDIVVIKKTSEFQKGDIVYYRMDDHYFIHRIAEMDPERITTIQDVNGHTNPFKIPSENLLGKAVVTMNSLQIGQLIIAVIAWYITTELIDLSLLKRERSLNKDLESPEVTHD